MKEYQGYLIDLDGTMYRGTEKIEAAADFIQRLNKKRNSLFICNQ